MTPLTTKVLDELERLEKAARSGPWHAGWNDDEKDPHYCTECICGPLLDVPCPNWAFEGFRHEWIMSIRVKKSSAEQQQIHDDIALIALLRTHARALIAAARKEME